MNRAVHVLGVLCIALWSSPGWAIPWAYDGFDYGSDGSPLAGQEGGYGWTGPWVEAGSGAGDEFTLSLTDTSLELPSLPFEPVGGHAAAAGPMSGGNNNIIRRPLANAFDLGTDGTLFASYLMVKSGSEAGSGDNQELDLLSGTSPTIRLGSTSGDRFWVGTSSNNFEDVIFDETYFVVLKVDAVETGDDLLSMAVFDSTESIPAGEPGSYDATYSFSSSSVINGARFWIGTNASGMYDELRFGPTWEEVTSENPNFVVGDFDGVDGITTADYQILSDNLYTGTTYEEGDINLSGLVDLTDFAMFRDVYQNAGLSLAELSTPVPEPTTGLLLIVAGLCCGLFGGRCRCD